MNVAIWICIFLPLFIIFFTEHQAKKRIKQTQILKKIKIHRKKGDTNMSEVVKRFIGKKCIIKTMNESVTGVIEAIEDNWIVVLPAQKNIIGTEVICIDYISRIQEYPKDRNGKEKTIVFSG